MRTRLNEIRLVASVQLREDAEETKIGVVKRKKEGNVYFDIVTDAGESLGVEAETFEGAIHAVWAIWGRLDKFQPIEN